MLPSNSILKTKYITFAILLAGLTFLAAGCGKSPVGPGKKKPKPQPKSPVNLKAHNQFSPVVIKISKIGTAHPQASVRPLSDYSGLSAVPGSAAGSSSPPSFTSLKSLQIDWDGYGGGTASGGQRYVHVKYKVRNASYDSTAYTQPLTNLIFIAVGNSQTIGHTPFLKMVLQSGTVISATNNEAQGVALAKKIKPTGGVLVASGSLKQLTTDVLQIFKESELSNIDVSGPNIDVTNIFPYGFVTRNPGGSGMHTRTLPGSPGPGDYDGRVTFAFRLPKNSHIQTLYFLALPVTSDRTRLTQSLQEQTPQAAAAIAAEAAHIHAGLVTLLPGAVYPGLTPTRRLCGPVRLTGTKGSPTSVLFAAPPTYQSLSPDPGQSIISRNTTFKATYSSAARHANSNTFTVSGSQSGRLFVGKDYSGNGTPTVSTPQAHFFPGELVNVTLTSGLGTCKSSIVARYRVGVAPSSGHFASTVNIASARSGRSAASPPPVGTAVSSTPAYTLPVGNKPVGIVALDFGNDTDEGFAVANKPDSTVTWYQSLDGNNFDKFDVESVGGHPTAITGGDFDGDGYTDIAVTDGPEDKVVIMRNHLGVDNVHPPFFIKTQEIPVGDDPVAITTGDWDGDGDIDLAVANQGSDDVSILLNKGNGEFTVTETVHVVANYVNHVGLTSITSGDWNNDGKIDLAVSGFANFMTTLKNKGSATFTQGVVHLVAQNALFITAGDWNSDGYPDLAVSDLYTLVRIFQNNSGTFTKKIPFIRVVDPYPHPGLPYKSRSLSIAVGDIEGDGDLDLVVANKNYNNVSILKYDNGSGHFSLSSTLSVGNQPVSLALFDGNGDGTLDLAVVNQGDDNVTIYDNN